MISPTNLVTTPSVRELMALTMKEVMNMQSHKEIKRFELRNSSVVTSPNSSALKKINSAEQLANMNITGNFPMISVI
jgi:hypothetical protein